MGKFDNDGWWIVIIKIENNKSEITASCIVEATSRERAIQKSWDELNDSGFKILGEEKDSREFTVLTTFYCGQTKPEQVI